MFEPPTHVAAEMWEPSVNILRDTSRIGWDGTRGQVVLVGGKEGVFVVGLVGCIVTKMSGKLYLSNDRGAEHEPGRSQRER
jgi:hypothetical protein